MFEGPAGHTFQKRLLDNKSGIRVSTPWEDNRYFSSSGLPATQHIEVLTKFEEIIVVQELRPELHYCLRQKRFH